MFESIKTIFVTPSLIPMKRQELREAALALGAAKTAVEYAQSLVNYNTQRVNRLKEEIIEYSKDEFFTDTKI